MVNLSGPSREPWSYGKVLHHLKHLKATAKTPAKATVSTSGPRKAPGDSPGVTTTAVASASRPRSTPWPWPTSAACSTGHRATPKTLATVNALRGRRKPAHRGEAASCGAGLVSPWQSPWAPRAHGAVPSEHPVAGLKTSGQPPTGLGGAEKSTPKKNNPTIIPYKHLQDPRYGLGRPPLGAPRGSPPTPRTPFKGLTPGGWGW